ncbi:MAG: ppsA [Clostridiales bacterium]|jgi:pyruvate,water dikinase|nr:ppsA [Clostridiales bacterium]
MSVVSFGQLTRGNLELAGGKGASLNDMVSAGFPVPEGYVVCSDAFNEFREKNKLVPEILDLIEKTDLDDSAQLEETSQKIKNLILNASIPGSAKQEIITKYQELSSDQSDFAVAVRSSSTAEDLDDASFAGQQETFLYVIGEEELVQKVKECWASLYNSRAIFYRQEKGFSEKEVSIAVVVQRMINSEKAGVMFTVNPMTKQHDSAIIEAVWGLGEGAVSGLVTPDSYLVNKKTLEIEMEYVADKEVMIVQSVQNRGVVERPVPSELVSKRILTDEEIKSLVRYGIKSEEFFEKPQDLEWAIEGSTVYILQSRAITTI